MDTQAVKKLAYMTFGAAGIGLAITALFLLSRTAQNSEDFDRLHIVILLILFEILLHLFFM